MFRPFLLLLLGCSNNKIANIHSIVHSAAFIYFFNVVAFLNVNQKNITAADLKKIKSSINFNKIMQPSSLSHQLLLSSFLCNDDEQIASDALLSRATLGRPHLYQLQVLRQHNSDSCGHYALYNACQIMYACTSYNNPLKCVKW